MIVLIRKNNDESITDSHWISVSKTSNWITGFDCNLSSCCHCYIQVCTAQRWPQCGSVFCCCHLPPPPPLLLLQPHRPLILLSQPFLANVMTRDPLETFRSGSIFVFFFFFLLKATSIHLDVCVCMDDLQSLDGMHRITTCKASTSSLWQPIQIWDCSQRRWQTLSTKSFRAIHVRSTCWFVGLCSNRSEKKKAERVSVTEAMATDDHGACVCSNRYETVCIYMYMYARCWWSIVTTTIWMAKDEWTRKAELHHPRFLFPQLPFLYQQLGLSLSQMVAQRRSLSNSVSFTTRHTKLQKLGRTLSVLEAMTGFCSP